MKDNLIVTPDNMAVFERSLDMIDTSIKELRRVAHNMMPEMLVKFGLDEALKEYCNAINGAKLMTIKYQSFGMESRIDGSAEIIIYRIVQEVLSNMVKHARASHIEVEAARNGDGFNLTIKDNGKGFDTNQINRSKGLGWKNIAARVNMLDGKMEVRSELLTGTQIEIIIPKA